jgi:hypothetical protein
MEVWQLAQRIAHSEIGLGFQDWLLWGRLVVRSQLCHFLLPSFKAFDQWARRRKEYLLIHVSHTLWAALALAVLFTHGSSFLKPVPGEVLPFGVQSGVYAHIEGSVKRLVPNVILEVSG